MRITARLSPWPGRVEPILDQISRVQDFRRVVGEIFLAIRHVFLIIDLDFFIFRSIFWPVLQLSK
jgi:hypothetical protein